MLGALAFLNGVALEAIGLPHVCDVLAKGAADNANARCDHERGVEAHAELTDDVHVGTLVLGVGLLELLAAGMSNGAEVVLQVLGGHANTVVRYGEGAGIAIERNANGEVLVVQLNARVGKALKIELVHRV